MAFCFLFVKGKKAAWQTKLSAKVDEWVKQGVL
jgi:hypothetical protein